MIAATKNFVTAAVSGAAREACQGQKQDTCAFPLTVLLGNTAILIILIVAMVLVAAFFSNRNRGDKSGEDVAKFFLSCLRALGRVIVKVADLITLTPNNNINKVITAYLLCVTLFIVISAIAVFSPWPISAILISTGMLLSFSIFYAWAAEIVNIFNKQWLKNKYSKFMPLSLSGVIFFLSNATYILNKHYHILHGHEVSWRPWAYLKFTLDNLWQSIPVLGDVPFVEFIQYDKIDDPGHRAIFAFYMIVVSIFTNVIFTGSILASLQRETINRNEERELIEELCKSQCNEERLREIFEMLKSIAETKKSHVLACMKSIIDKNILKINDHNKGIITMITAHIEELEAELKPKIVYVPKETSTLSRIAKMLESIFS